jgi:hypothetical protein
MFTQLFRNCAVFHGSGKWFEIRAKTQSLRANLCKYRGGHPKGYRMGSTFSNGLFRSLAGAAHLICLKLNPAGVREVRRIFLPDNKPSIVGSWRAWN